jgi:hypothetical protein
MNSYARHFIGHERNLEYAGSRSYAVFRKNCISMVSLFDAMAALTVGSVQFTQYKSV